MSEQKALRAARRRSQRPDAADRVHGALVEAITDQRLGPGAKLGEVELASVFGCSRRPVEQALVRLAVERLAIRTPNRGAFIATPSPQEAREVFALRRAVEAAAARDLAHAITPERLAPLRAVIAEEAAALKAGDERRAIRLSGAFHVVLAEAGGNGEFVDLVRRLVARTSLITQLYGAVSERSHWACDHCELLEAIERADGDAAAALMVRHLEGIERASRLDVAGKHSSPLRRALAP